MTATSGRKGVGLRAGVFHAGPDGPGRADLALGEETGGGPDRKKYEITLSGKARVREWLFTPDVPSETLQSELFAKTVIALLIDDDADRLLDVQRGAHGPDA